MILKHKYGQTKYNKTEQYCPECGECDVWVEDGEGNYYHGPQYICMRCHCSGTEWYGFKQAGLIFEGYLTGSDHG